MDDLDAAEGWFYQINGIFENMKLNDNAKMELVPFFLEGKASLWWKDVMDRHKSYSEGKPGQRPKELDWMEFEKEFHNEFNSEAA